MPFDEALPMNLKQEITVTGTNFASKFFDWISGAAGRAASDRATSKPARSAIDRISLKGLLRGFNLAR
jgi:hypothetical protein